MFRTSMIFLELEHIGRYNYHGNIGLTVRDNSGELLDADSRLMRNN